MWKKVLVECHTTCINEHKWTNRGHLYQTLRKMSFWSAHAVVIAARTATWLIDGQQWIKQQSYIEHFACWSSVQQDRHVRLPFTSDYFCAVLSSAWWLSLVAILNDWIRAQRTQWEIWREDCKRERREQMTGSGMIWYHSVVPGTS